MEDNINDKVILRQLHEQYAINNNNSLSAIVAIITALLASFAGYGYVFINSANLFHNDLKSINGHQNMQYCLDTLFYSAIAVIFILAFIACVCIYQGTYQRKEQFITYAIREKYKALYELVFPDNYHPYNKGRLEMIQGLYGEFIKFIIAAFILILLSLLIKLGYNIFDSHTSKTISENAMWVLIIFIIITSSIFCSTIEYYNYNRNKYLQIQEKYFEKSKIKIAESQQIKIKKKMQMNCKRICNCWIVGSVLICIFIFLAILSHFY